MYGPMTEDQHESALERAAAQRVADVVFVLPVKPMAAIEAELPTLMQAEFSEKTYEWLKELYASQSDPTVAKRVGRAAVERGGVPAMQGLYYGYGAALMLAAEELELPSGDYRLLKGYYLMMLERYWDGLGGWSA